MLILLILLLCFNKSFLHLIFVFLFLFPTLVPKTGEFLR